MRKVGDILKKRRLEKNFTLEDVEKRTKIRTKFLQAIEEGNYSVFSSSTYLRGFIKNYSDFLLLPTSEILAIFRREFDKKDQLRIIPKGLSGKPTNPLIHVTPAGVSVITVITLILIFFTYLIRGYLSVTGVPDLVITQPEPGAVVRVEKIIVSGKTDPQAKLSINNQEVLVGEDGSFSQEVGVSNNTASLNIVAENKEGKKAVIERIIDVQLP